MVIFRATLLSGFIAVVLSACGGGELPPEEPTPVPEEVAPFPELPSIPVESGSLGALYGVIRIEGRIPQRFDTGASKVAGCDHFPDVDQRTDMVLVEEGLLQNACVSLISGFEADQIPPVPTEPAVLDQRGCIYIPHASWLRTGQTLRILNSDPATHNVNIKAKRNRSSNVSMVAGQEALEVQFQRSDQVRLKCDIHPWMSAVVFVRDHPWVALSGPDGAFEIPDIPPGAYVAEVAHEVFGKLRGSILIQEETSSGIEVTFQVEE